MKRDLLNALNAIGNAGKVNKNKPLKKLIGSRWLGDCLRLNPQRLCNVFKVLQVRAKDVNLPKYFINPT